MSQHRLVNVDRILAGLKRFQRDTVEHVFHHLFLDPGSPHRFLVADEVGLGKTLVAKGVVARAIDHLQQQGVHRIDIVYICSNADIARQNINRLNVTGREIAPVPRITMLPAVLKNLREQRLNLIALTPGTSLDLRSSMGIWDERVVLYWMLRKAWGFGDETGPKNLLQGSVTDAGWFRQQLDQSAGQGLDEALLDGFRSALAGRRELRQRFDEAAAQFRYVRRRGPEERREQTRMVGELRTVLARACVTALEPDLVILDEFQRFNHLLTGDGDAALLAQQLFEWESGHEHAKVLLLSATPYKMLTLHNDNAGDDHHRDFLKTVSFLLRNDATTVALLRGHLAALRRELFRPDEGSEDRLRGIREQVETILRRVMVRTERLAVTENRDGMVVSMQGLKHPVSAREVEVYPVLADVAKQLGAGEVMEFWKSTPYVLNFMEDYELKKELAQALGDMRCRPVGRALAGCPGALLPWEKVAQYAPLHAPSARLADLEADTLDRGTWRLLWIPPSLPYYELGGPFAQAGLTSFTKRLVFSSWTVVPRALAGLLSYGAEQRIASAYDSDLRNTPEARKGRKPTLVFTSSDGRLTGMPVLALLYPSAVLARVGDSLDHAKGSAQGFDQEALLRQVEAQVEAELQHLPAGPSAGRIDERWYWLAPALLDLVRDGAATRSWLEQRDLPAIWSGGSDEPVGDDGPSRWAEHVRELADMACAQGMTDLGRRPEDLGLVLAQLAVAGPANCAMRALGRVAPEVGALGLHNAAAKVAWGFRALFNSPESTALIRGLRPEEPYWRRVVEYALDGCLQAVLDEYAHVLVDHLGLGDAKRDDVVKGVANAIHDALTVRAASLRVDDIEATAESCTKLGQRGLRAHFALHFGDQRQEDGREGARRDRVRDAFNSPFWPFVLVTTSVGQEGLDFHLYCHAVVHWNLPSNAVDLEQREGRVHRFKGHAVRKNVAKVHRAAVLGGPKGVDPWAALFHAAWRVTGEQSRDIQPFWVFPAEGGASIERYVPAAPLSRDLIRYEALKRTLAVYRLAFGQPRQEDLLAFLVEHSPPEQLQSILDSARIDLSPRPRAESAEIDR